MRLSGYPREKSERPGRPSTAAGVRRLIGTEELFWRLDGICPMNLAVHARIAGELCEGDLRQGLADAQARHPMLRMRIVARGGSAWFGPSAAPIGLRVEFASPGELPSIYAQEGQTRFNTADGPLSRAVLVRHGERDATLILTFHHAIADAKSALIVLRDTFRRAGEGATGEPGPPPPPGLESQRSRFPPRTRGIRGWVRYVAPLARFMAAAIRRPPADVSAHDGWAPDEPPRLHVVPVEVNALETRRLVQRARVEGTTVHAALQASLALALAEETGCRLPATALFGTAVCLRSLLEPPVGETCGYFVSGLAWLDEIGAKDGSLWHLARRLKGSIEAAIARDEHWLVLPHVNQIHAWVGRFTGSGRGTDRYARYLQKTSPLGVMVSNVGRWTFETNFGALRLEGAGFFANQSVLGNVALLALTVNDRLALDFVGSSPDVSRECLTRVATRCVGFLAATAAVDVPSVVDAGFRAAARDSASDHSFRARAGGSR